jgi:hypothetical protein
MLRKCASYFCERGRVGERKLEKLRLGIVKEHVF